LDHYKFKDGMQQSAMVTANEDGNDEIISTVHHDKQHPAKK